ncbi:MAG TPA: hypothetical protein VGH22_19090 [Candidatus Binatia bacterium]|jgi:hypothetical protein
MDTSTSYGQQLRSLGQYLEAQRISIFELTCRGERFVVKGAPEKETSLLAALRQWQQRRRSDGLNASLVVTRNDLDQLERQGRAQRKQSNRLPDFYRLPNALRTVGQYLELKGAELLELQKRQLSLTVLSRNKDGHPQMEERSLASFYDLFLKLHDKRGKTPLR